MSLLAATPFSERADGLRRLDTFVSRYTGVISDAHELVRRPGEAGFVRFAALPTVAADLLGVPLVHLEGASGGVGVDRAGSRAAAVGEVLERYSASWLPRGSVLATASELGPEAVDPSAFALFAPEQYAEPGFPFTPFTDETRLRWVPGFELPGGDPVWLPAQIVLLGAEPDPEEERIDSSSSNGLACGQTIEEAVLTGLLETLERDAFLLTWLHRLSLQLVDWRDEPELARLAGRALDPVRVEYDLVDLSGFWHVPTALAVARGGPGDGAALGVGAAAAATPEGAAVKALGEAFSVRAWLLHLRDQSPWEPLAAEEVVDFPDHVRFYGDEDRSTLASFLWASTARRPFGRLPRLLGSTPLAQIEELCRRLTARGLRAYAADLTSPDVAAGGLFVARALVPGLLMLDADHARRHLGGRRALCGAADAGLGPRVERVDQLNSDPHPFP